MGCGQSTRTTKQQKDNYNSGYDTWNRSYDNRPEPYYQQDSQIEDNMYHGHSTWNDADYHDHASELKKYNPPESDDENEDITPFDDDDVTDHDKYHRIDNGLFIKRRDFRHRFVDEKQEKRPQINSGKLYVDDEFPLKDALRKDNADVDWRRPKEFMEKPRLFTDGATSFDIGQGAVGTCWFLSVLTNIANNKEIMKQMIPQDAYTIEDPSRYDGVFHARFYKFGRWEDVYIDDYLPVIKKNRLWGARSATDKNELWISLLEKAFAKMNGSYDAVYGNQLGDTYLQLTGGFGERVELHNMKQGDNAKRFFDRIKNALRTDCQVSCLVLDEFDKYKGLEGGHAYSVIDVFEDKTNQIKLIKLRNPWGKGEWTGPWSDGSSEWSKIPNNSAIASKKGDGEFYVCLPDFLKYFSQTTICSLTPDFDCDGISDSLNYVLSICGEWNGKSAAGFHKLLLNQKFCFTVTDNGLVNNDYLPLVVQIVQQTKAKKIDDVPIRCDVFKVLADKILPKSRRIALVIKGTKNNVYTPELQTTFRYKLKPGRYVIIASTANKGQEKAFLLRLFTPAPLENIKEIPMKAEVMYCEKERTINIRDRTYKLTFEKALFGEFIKGHNAGGQVSNRNSYHLNPQYLITIPETGSEVPLVAHIMQTQEDPTQAIGIRIFKLDNAARPPLNIKYLYDYYDHCPADMDGSRTNFMISQNVEARYLLKPGRYVALIYLDQPNTERSFCILFKSTVHVGIKGFQTG